MSRRNLVCLILSLIGIAYIVFGSLSLQEHSESKKAAQKEDAVTLEVPVPDGEEASEAVPPATDDQEETISDVQEEISEDAESEVLEESSDLQNEDDIQTTQGGSFFEKLALQEDVKILVIGDSIGLGIGASDESNRWDRLMQLYLERKYKSSVTVQNECFGGCTSYGTYVHMKELAEEVRDYDLTIICSGQNDPDEGFSEIYEALLRNINREFESSSILCILESTQHTMTDKMVTIRDLAEHYNAGVVDTIAAFEKNYDSLTQNGFYPNDEGQEMYFRTIINVIDPLVTSGTGVKIGGADDTSVPEPVNQNVVRYDALSFYSVQEIERTDSVRYTLKLPYTDVEGNVLETAGGILGIKMYSPSGEFPVTCAVDGEIQGETIIVNYTDKDEDRYYSFGEFAAGRTIRIKFESEEVAERLTGIYISSAQ